jgi:hypothetical protein
VTRKGGSFPRKRESGVTCSAAQFARLAGGFAATLEKSPALTMEILAGSI